MNISTFEDDLLELQGFSKQLEQFIDTEHAFVDGSLVIALSSKFGSGKSTFLNMWRTAIENAEEDESKPFEPHRVENISELIGALKLTPRQIQEVFRTLGHMFETTEENRGRLLWCLGVGSIAMAAFKIGAPDVYHSLGNQQYDPVEAWSFLNRTLGEAPSPDWWFTLFLTGGGLHAEEGESPEDMMRRAGVIQQGENMGRELSHWWSGWGQHSSNRFNQIYEKIQQISQWR